jgi:hypothetical protein
MNYSMRFLGMKSTFDVLGTEVVGRIIERTKASYLPTGHFPRNVLIYGNGTFTVAMVGPEDIKSTGDPDRLYVGVSKKCDRDPVNLSIGIKVATARACRAYCIAENELWKAEQDG